MPILGNSTHPAQAPILIESYMKEHVMSFKNFFVILSYKKQFIRPMPNVHPVHLKTDTRQTKNNRHERLGTRLSQSRDVQAPIHNNMLHDLAHSLTPHALTHALSPSTMRVINSVAFNTGFSQFLSNYSVILHVALT